MAVEPRVVLRLLAKQAQLDALHVLRNRRVTVIWTITDIIGVAAGVSGTLLLAQRFSGIGDQSKWQIFFMLGFAQLVNAILSVFFGFNLRMISRRIGRGQLDHMLLSPHPLWRTFLTEGFVPVSELLVLLVSVSFLAWTATHLPGGHGALWYVALVAALLGAGAILMAFQLLWGSLAFWAPMAAEEINSSTSSLTGQLGTLPLNTVSPGLRGVLLSVVPVGLLGWFPARALSDAGAPGASALVVPLLAPVFVAAAVLVFRRGLAHYARIGSQRYLSFGHRR